jgi:type I restriction enzyme S subunit
MVLADSEYCISRQLMAIRVIDWDVHFLFSLLKQDESLFGAAAIGLIPGLSRMDILNKFIPLPQKMQEQTAIATALSDTDALIASLEKLIEKKRAIKLGAMQELLKPKEGWLVRRLGDCLIGTPNYGINAAAVAYSDILPTYIRITDISEDGRFCLENMRSVDSPFSGNYILDEGDIVFARTGASVGKTYLYNKSDGLLVFAGFLIRIKVNPKILNPFYLQNYTTTREYWNWVKVMSMRSGQPGINGNEFSQLEVPVPPSILEQNRIATILNDMDTNISTLEQKLSKYKLLKQGMMQELLTGKTRLV